MKILLPSPPGPPPFCWKSSHWAKYLFRKQFSFLLKELNRVFVNILQVLFSFSASPFKTSSIFRVPYILESSRVDSNLFSNSISRSTNNKADNNNINDRKRTKELLKSFIPLAYSFVFNEF